MRVCVHVHPHLIPMIMKKNPNNSDDVTMCVLTRLLAVRCACSVVTGVLMLGSVFTGSRRRLFILSYLGSLTSTVSDDTK